MFAEERAGSVDPTVGRARLVRPPSVEYQAGVDFVGRRLRSVFVEQRCLSLPVAAVPEAPHQKIRCRRAAVDHLQELIEEVSLVLVGPVLVTPVELGNPEVSAVTSVQVEPFEDLGRRERLLSLK